MDCISWIVLNQLKSSKINSLCTSSIREQSGNEVAYNATCNTTCYGKSEIPLKFIVASDFEGDSGQNNSANFKTGFAV